MSIVAFTLFGAGVMSWSFGEYALHRWAGHEAKGKNEFSREHLAHHADVTYFASSWKKAKMAMLMAVLLALILVPLAGALFAFSYIVGFVSMYLAYEFLHRRLHTHAPWGAYGRWARKHHFFHHFSSPKKNHGVTSPIWDIVFGTYEAVPLVSVPRRQAMSWLTNPENEEILPAFTRDYQLIGRLASR